MWFKQFGMLWLATCCECGTPKHLVQWLDGRIVQHVCIDCAARLHYADYMHPWFSERLYGRL